MNHALRRVALACLVMFLVLLANSNYVQVFQASSLASDPGNVRTSLQPYQYQRGSIITADGKAIAESRPLKSGPYKYQRYYPDGKTYAPVTGFYPVNGSPTGIEAAENKVLSGNDPALAVHNLIDLVTGKPRTGATVQLTINSAAQQAAYAALAATGKPSGAVAIDPQTGAILALASYPTFNPNKLATLNGAQFDKVDSRYNREVLPMLNQATGVLYPPGSTFKVVTGSTAFSTGKYTPQTLFPAPTNLSMPGTSKQLINYDNFPCSYLNINPTGTGKVPLAFAFAESCNTVYGELGIRLGGTALQQMATRFGMNDPHLTIPLPVTGSQYQAVSSPPLTAYSAIGQYNDRVTALQEAMFASAIADNGTLMTPYLVKQVTPPGQLTPLSTTTPKVMSHPVTPKVAAMMKQMMIGVVKQPYGTAYHTANLPGLDIAAKTGTAQNGVNNTGTDDAVFTSFAPSGNPQIAVGVVVRGGGFGADASAPVAVAIIKAYLASLGRR